MKYPEVNIKIDEPPNEQAIRAEFRRFKNLQITGLDNSCENVADIIRHPSYKDKKETSKEKDREIKYERDQDSVSNEHPSENHDGSPSSFNLPADLPKELKEKMIEQIKMSDCQVRLVDISSMNDEMSLNSSTANDNDGEARSSLRMTISTSALNSHRSEKSSSSSKKKKKKHKRTSSP